MMPCWPVKCESEETRQLGNRRQAAVSGTYGCMLRKDDPQFKKLMDDTSLRCRPPVKRKNGLINGSKINSAEKPEHEFRTVRRNESTVKEPNDKALN